MNPEYTDPSSDATGEQPEQPLDAQPAVEVTEPKPDMAPVAANERIDLIDILRGMALFGILAANMRGFGAPAQVYGNINRLFTSNADWIAQAFVNSVFQGKFVTLFSFLFGLGFAVQMTRAQERGKSVSFYPRRLFFLLCFGMVHAWLIWWGDILFDYALCGFVLLLFRKRTTKTIAIWSLSLFAAIPVLITGFYIASFFGFHGFGGPGDPAKFNAALQHSISVYRDGSYFAMVRLRFQDWWEFHRPPGPIFLLVFVLPRFLAGLWVWRTGLVTNPEPFLPTIKKICGWGFVIGLICDAVSLYVQFIVKPKPGSFTFPGYLSGVAQQISYPAIAAFYACGVLLLVQSPVWKRRLTPFGAVGRMALTNYLTESIVCTWIFHWTRLYGKVGPAIELIPTVVLFAIQILFSVWWLKRYQFGPAEWLWRCLTYGKMQPMRRVSVESPGFTTLAAQA